MSRQANQSTAAIDRLGPFADLMLPVELAVSEEMAGIAQYTLETLLRPLGIRPVWHEVTDGEVGIQYGGQHPTESTTLHIPCVQKANDVFLGHRDVSMDAQEALIGGHAIPLLFEGDWIAEAFFWLSDWQTVIISQRDRYGRFLYEHSMQKRLGILPIPIVDLIREQLAAELAQRGFRIPRLDDLEEPAVCITHDIDHLHKWTIRRIVFETSRALTFSQTSNESLSNSWTQVCSTVDPYEEGIEYLLRSHESNGHIATWFFKAGGGASEDSGYRIESRQAGHLLRSLLASKHELGLHTAFFHASDPSRMISERNRVEVLTGIQIESVRQHYLRHEGNRTNRAQLDAGFQVDSSLSFADSCGFRNGTSFPFRFYDTIQMVPTGIWEIPPVIHDTPLMRNEKGDIYFARNTILYWLDWLQQTRGIGVILWHNVFLDRVAYNGWQEVYDYLLDILSDRSIKSSGLLAALSAWLCQFEKTS